MLVLTRKADESVTIGNDIVVTVLKIEGNYIRLGFDAPKEIPIHRTEVFERIQAEYDASKDEPGAAQL